jgi:hypothetical protein
LILSGCDNAQKAGTNYLAQQMRDPDSAKFRDVQTVTDSADPYVQNICGFVNGKNLFAYTVKNGLLSRCSLALKNQLYPLEFHC